MTKQKEKDPQPSLLDQQATSPTEAVPGPEPQLPAVPEPVTLPTSGLRNPGAWNLAPRDLTEAIAIADRLAKSDMVPKNYRDKPENIIVAGMHGGEIGLGLLQSMQSIAVINGIPSIYGDVALALVRASGKLGEWEEPDYNNLPVDEVVPEVDVEKGPAIPNYVCRTRAKRADTGEEIVRSFSVLDAVRAELWGKAGPWTTYPRRMLLFRARSFVLRDGFSDVLRGMAIAEEVRDYPAGGIEGRTTATQRRLSEKYLKDVTPEGAASSNS